jgi:hypothetical protein
MRVCHNAYFSLHQPSQIKQCGEAGVPVVQIRDKEMPSEVSE